MTCIVALEFEDKVYMGGDSESATGWDTRILVHPKIFKLGDMLIGCSGSLRMQQLIQFVSKVPDNTCGNDSMRYFVTQFIPAMQECLKDNGYTKIEDNKEETDSILLIGWRGRIYTIHMDFQVYRINIPFAAIGCGENYAMGAMAAMGQNIKNPGSAILKSLEIAGRFSNGVSGPYYVYSI